MSYKALLPLVALLSFASAAPSAAQVLVFGEGNAQLCYMSAKTGDGGTRGAIQNCTDALSEPLTRKDEASTYVNRGILLMRSGQYEKAVQDYQDALALKEDLSEAHINYGVALYYTEQYDEALIAVNRALELGTKREAEALYNRALVHDRQGNLRAAYDDLTQALVLKPEWDIAERALSRYEVRPRSQAQRRATQDGSS